MVDGIGEELRLKSQTFTVVQSLATLACAISFEEVTAIELHTHLVAPQLHLTTALGLGQLGIPSVSFHIRFVDNPIVVVTFGISQLLIIGSNVVANAVFLAEIERSLFHTGELAIGNQVLVDGGHIA